MIRIECFSLFFLLQLIPWVDSHMTAKPYSAFLDPEAITDDDDDCNSNSDCVHGSYGSSLSLRGARADDNSSSRPSSPFNLLKPQDVLPIETARARILDIIVHHFIGENVIEVAESSGLIADDRVNKRKRQEVQYEGDPAFALPLMYIANLYENLVSEINARLASLVGFREKTIGVALEAAGGLYRKLSQKFPKKGTCSFKRRELATSHATRTKFPELVVHDEKRVRFVVINGLVIIDRPKNITMEDAEWFKRLTGRSEVAISSKDYKFYSPRHKYRHITQPALAEVDSSPLVCSSEFRPPNERLNQQKSLSKRHTEQPENQPYLHLLDQPEQDTIQQNRHSTQFHPHQCITSSHLSDNSHQQQSYLPPQTACLQAGQCHLGGRMNIAVSDLHLVLVTITQEHI
ncbi:hypothetical protein GUJ93_ZPchr0006g44799 [Zizania palustris]|uniref:Uncharacterized protein n=1 Tax=Zizania palustris TaxID=103762 RepID=A0A8J5SRL8_ZIZPA|nr:hypothetical protein GUJ93_ZPchr0006g44799 [Zizania palustris]